jgi:DNA mismatch endonuclease (patch repair protein)
VDALFGEVAPGTHRSMTSNRRRDTTPELAVRKLLHATGLRFRVDYPIRTSERAVRVDIAFQRAKLAVFIDGCFWHRCPQHGTMPTRNRDYWEPKLARNVERDAHHVELLEAEGWHVLRFWTHEPPERIRDSIAFKLSGASRPQGAKRSGA